MVVVVVEEEIMVVEVVVVVVVVEKTGRGGEGARDRTNTLRTWIFS